MLARRLDNTMTLLRSTMFPQVFGNGGLPYGAYIGIGGNIGDVARRFERLLHFFRRDPYVHVRATSPLLKNPPFGYADQNDFLNAVLEIETSLQPGALMRHLLGIERRFGRRRTFPNAPRTLDIDILFYGQRQIRTPVLTLPHPHWHERLSVVIPLNYLLQARR